jgi:hypothetical protein
MESLILTGFGSSCCCAAALAVAQSPSRRRAARNRSNRCVVKVGWETGTRCDARERSWVVMPTMDAVVGDWLARELAMWRDGLTGHAHH